jgi:hypothetical protein
MAPDYRATILGGSSFLNGINTIALSLFVDPYLLKISKHKFLRKRVYNSLVMLRLQAIILSAILLIFSSILAWYFS